MELAKSPDISIRESAQNLEDTRQILSKTITGLLIRGEKLNVLNEKVNYLTEGSNRMKNQSGCVSVYCCIV